MCVDWIGCFSLARVFGCYIELKEKREANVFIEIFFPAGLYSISATTN